MGHPQRKQPGREELHPLETASWWSMLSWSWLYGMLAHGVHHPLKEDDVWSLPKSHRAASVRERFDSLGVRPEACSLVHVMRSLFWRRWVLAGFLYVCWCISAGIQPFLVAAFINHLETEEGSQAEAIALSVGPCAF